MYGKLTYYQDKKTIKYKKELIRTRYKMANKHSHRRKKKEKKNNMGLGMSIFIVFIMVTSVFGVMFYGFTGSGGEVIRYNDYKFRQTNLGYETTIANQKFYFEYLPEHTQDIEIIDNVTKMIGNSNGIIITSDIDSTYKEDIALTSYNLNTLLTTQNKYSANAFTNNSGTLPSVTCENASIAFPIVYIKESNATEIVLNDDYQGCIEFNFDTSYNLRRATAKFMYVILGIMD